MGEIGPYFCSLPKDFDRLSWEKHLKNKWATFTKYAFSLMLFAPSIFSSVSRNANGILSMWSRFRT